MFISIYERKRRYEGAWHVEQRKLFPGYLFVISDELKELCTALENMTETAKFIGTGSEIVPLVAEEALMMERLINEDGLVEFSYGVINGGETHVTSGPLKGLESCISRIDRHKRIADLDFELMGRPMKMQAGLEIVEKD